MSIRSTYLEYVFQPNQFRKIIRACVSVLRPRKDTFDAIAFRGMSGGMVGAALASAMNKYAILVRKDDGNHSGHKVEGFLASQNYFIVDDFIAGGNTIRTIKDELHKAQDNFGYNPANCLGVLAYLRINDSDNRAYYDEKVKDIMGPQAVYLPCFFKKSYNDD